MTEIKNIVKKKGKITTGVSEWADSGVNLYSGCSNNCSYCYAKRMAIRFNRKTEENWHIMEPNYEAMKKGYGKRGGRVMFPTSHDITLETYEPCKNALKKLLEAGNEVLITTKPNLVIISKLCIELAKYIDLVQFRFTITSLDNNILKMWEPNAPCFNDRFLSLVLAFSMKYKTSVSIEPFLDKNPFLLIKKVAPFCTESIWIGKLNYDQRGFNSWENVQEVINCLGLLPLNVKNRIRIKDSIKNLYFQHEKKLIF